MSVWDKIKGVFSEETTAAELGEEYVELETEAKDKTSKVIIKPFTLNKFDDIRGVLNAIREGYTISILNIAPLKEKDISELKRAVDKIKKTVEANEGDIAGFGENFLVVTPSFAKVDRAKESADGPAEPAAEEDI
ncbi:MAG: cell division protein SepF [DPANN group archaeon]|nr:cell division protein SepF [DPANN group archaeon]